VLPEKKVVSVAVGYLVGGRLEIYARSLKAGSQRILTLGFERILSERCVIELGLTPVIRGEVPYAYHQALVRVCISTASDSHVPSSDFRG
jgi:hypothetical protein